MYLALWALKKCPLARAHLKSTRFPAAMGRPLHCRISAYTGHSTCSASSGELDCEQCANNVIVEAPGTMALPHLELGTLQYFPQACSSKRRTHRRPKYQTCAINHMCAHARLNVVGCSRACFFFVSEFLSKFEDNVSASVSSAVRNVLNISNVEKLISIVNGMSTKTNVE